VVRILDLFSGMGGLSLGFSLALGDAEILGLDNDRYAVDTYNHNLRRFGAKAIVQDVLKWGPRGKYDIVMGGSPCQPFSLANTRKRGEEHPLYPTFPRFFDIVLELEPKVFLLENVKGLLTRRHKHLLEGQLKRIRPCYNVRYRVLNSAYYGVPQRRERVFVLGVRRDLGVLPSFPVPTHNERGGVTLTGKLHRWVTVREAIGDLLSIPPSNLQKLIYTPSQIGRVLRFRRGRLDDLDEPSRVIKVDGRGGDKTNDAVVVPVLSPKQVERIRKEREDTSRHFARMGFPDDLDKPSRVISSHTVEGTKRETIVVPITEHVMTEKGGWANPRSDWGSRVMPEDRPSYTITHLHRSGQLVRVPSEHEVKVYRMDFSPRSLRKHRSQELDNPSSTVRATFYKIPPDATVRYGATRRYRRLTVRECLRLQSFPDWWSFPRGVSTSRKYRLVGEAVPPVMAYRLAVHIGKMLRLELREPPSPEEWDLPFFHRVFADYFGDG